MTSNAGFGKDPTPPGGVRRKGCQLGHPHPCHLSRWGDPPRKKREIRDDFAHLLSVARQCRAIQAPLETVVDPIFQQIHQIVSGAVLGESGVGADQRKGPALGTVLQMAAEAAKFAAHMSGETVPGMGQQRVAPPYRSSHPVVWNFGFGREFRSAFSHDCRPGRSLLNSAAGKCRQQNAGTRHTTPSHAEPTSHPHPEVEFAGNI